MFHPPVHFGLCVRGVFALLSAMMLSIAGAEEPTVCFDFETDAPPATVEISSATAWLTMPIRRFDTQGWETIQGEFAELITDEPTAGMQGRYYLSTYAPRNYFFADTMVGIVESPVFELLGGEISLRVGGGNGSTTYVALCDLDGKELRRAAGQNNFTLDPIVWNVADLVGRKLVLRVVDHRLENWAFVLLDDVRLSGRIDNEATQQRRQRLREGREQARRRLAEQFQQRDFDEIVFAVRRCSDDPHWYANFGHWANDPNRWLSPPGGRLCKLNLRTGEATVLLDDPEGSVRDPQVHYDGRRILFSYRPGGTHYFHLYEIDAGGGPPRQLTDGPFDDIEPTWLPDGGIAFNSSRCKRWVNCMVTEVAVLHRCEADGSRIRPISSNIEMDNTPWPLPDGRLLYTRWEYVDRGQTAYHHLWTVNPDGTRQMVFFGNQRVGTTMIDAKPIPGTDRIVSIFSPGHGRREHAGLVTVLDPRLGPDAEAAARIVHFERRMRDPYPLDEHRLLAAKEGQVVLMNDRDTDIPLYQLPEEEVRSGLLCHEPRPLRPRPREAVIAPAVDWGRATGRLLLADLYAGRNMQGLRRGEIKRLLILETLPKPVNFSGNMWPTSLGGTFTLERIVGVVPVEADGSAHFELPAGRSFFFVALDENNLGVKRMQSFVSVQPGETTGCVGCHESRHAAPAPLAAASQTLAAARPPSPIEPIGPIPDVLDFPRDIQPILDRHCVACHDFDAAERGGPRAGGVILAGDRGPIFSHGYVSLLLRRQVADGANLPRSNYPPRTIGSSVSPLMDKLDSRHYNVVLSTVERDTIRLWIESGAVYAGTYAALATGMVGDWHIGEPEVVQAREVQQRRCAGCHKDGLALPQHIGDWQGLGPDGPRMYGPVMDRSIHLVYNLSRPAKSLLLLAPLAREAGGYGICGERAGAAPVFTSTDDADYRAMLAGIETHRQQLDQIKRFDMPGFLPNEHYVREMRRYGVLPVEYQPGAPIDIYDTDRRYWQSLWWCGEGE